MKDTTRHRKAKPVPGQAVPPDSVPDREEKGRGKRGSNPELCEFGTRFGAYEDCDKPSKTWLKVQLPMGKALARKLRAVPADIAPGWYWTELCLCSAHLFYAKRSPDLTPHDSKHTISWEEAERLEALRDELDITLKELAAETGYPATTLSRVFRMPDSEFLAAPPEIRQHLQRHEGRGALFAADEKRIRKKYPARP